MPRDTLSEMVTHYMATALWSSFDEPLDPSDISPETRAAMKRDCESFLDANFDDIFCDGAPSSQDGGVIGMAGHDFWLTRNGHGAGFWDGDWPEPHATRLTEASEAFGEFNLYVGKNGRVYHD